MQYKIIFYLSLLIALFACGGSSGNTESGDSPSSDIVNTGVSGKIFIGNRFGPWVLDLATGRYTRIVGTDWENEQDIYPGLADFTAYPLAYGDGEYVETVENCVVAFGADRDCIVFHNASGVVTDFFEIPDESFGPARMSADGLGVAVIMGRDSAPFKALNIYRRDGTLVASTASLARRVENHDFDWIMRNGGSEVLYVHEQSIYDSTDSVNPIVTIDASLGIPAEPSVSPDSTQIVFTIGDFRSSTGIKGTIWVVNTDGTGLRQLTQAEAGDENIVGHRSPVWSPDGASIFITDQTTINGMAYIVPANAERVLLTQDFPTVAQTIFSFYDDRRELQGSDPIDLETDFGIRSGSLAWLP